MGEAGPRQRTLIQVREHELQVARFAERADHRLDRIPVVVILDGCGARQQLAPQEFARLGPKRAVVFVKQEIAHGCARVRLADGFQHRIGECSQRSAVAAERVDQCFDTSGATGCRAPVRRARDT